MRKLFVLVLLLAMTSAAAAFDFCVTVKDADKDRVVNAMAALQNYQKRIPDPENAENTIPNPETKTQFTRKKLIGYLMDHLAGYEGRVAEIGAGKAAREKARDEVVIE